MNIQEKLTKIAEDMPKVYEAGVAEGKKSQYDEFWDAYQDNGARTNYNGAFAGAGWNGITLKPKYDIRPINASYMFYFHQNRTTSLSQLGVVIDFSNCTEMTHTFVSCSIPNLDIVFDCRKVSSLNNTFAYSATRTTIKKIIVAENTTYYNTFLSAGGLQNVVFEGTIGNDISFSQSTKLSHDSIVSIINALSTSTTGLTLTLSKTAVNVAFETSSGKNDGTSSAEWLALVATKPNWTISLA